MYHYLQLLNRGVAGIAAMIDHQLIRNKLSDLQAKGFKGLLKPTLSYDDLKDVDLVVEAVYEDLEVKRDVFKKLDMVCKADAILATNSSYLDVDQVGLIYREYFH